MRSLLLLVGASFASLLSYAQSDDCSTATTLPITANCSSPLSGTTIGATQSFTGCSGTADDDVWYQFTASSANHQITVNPSAGLDPVLQVFSGVCASLVSITCKDLGFAGDAEVANLSGLTIGQVYRVRVYHYAAGAGTGTFSICCTVGAAAPSNNNCSGATSLTVNVACSNTAGTTFGATQSMVGCAGNADDDVWYSFVATNATQTVTVTPVTSTMDPVFEVFSGSCASLTSELCVDQTFTNDPETSQIVGLTPGQTYFVRVYDYYQGNNGTFNICITGPATAAPTNDEPCNAIQLPAVTSNCNYLEFTTVGATTTLTPGAPSACVGGSGAMQGGYTTGTGTRDVWFRVTVPSSGNLIITPKPNMGAGRISDGVMVLYTGTCGSLTQVACSDDNNYPGTTNDLLPFINSTGLTPGSTVYIRFFGYGSTSGTFGLCITTASNDNCSSALYICDLNGYSASTSAAFTPDRPCNMRGNAETNNPPIYTYTPGTNQGGIFGSAGSWGTGSASQDVRIDNNSWIRFTASSTTAVLNVSVIDCWVGNYPSGGIQMQIFSSNGSCCNFTPVSNFEENSTGFTITGNNLTVGNDYYLMVDGYAGDICNYTITAQSGVLFPNITPVSPICAGQSVVLTAPAGATSYDWAHNGSTSQGVTVTPGTTQDYSVEVTGLCGYKQTLTTTVTVNPIPAAPIVSNTISVCQNGTLNLTASTVSGGTYSWTGPNGFTSSLQNPSISNVTAANAGTYSVTVTVNGCPSPSASTTVTINSIPAAPIAGSNSPVCVGQAINLTASNITNATYSWSGPSSFSSSLQNPTRASAVLGFAGTYTVNATVNGCTSANATVNVVVNPLPSAPVASSNSPICSGNTINLSATTVASATYTWSGPNSFSASGQNQTIPSSTAAMAGTYTVTATVNGCASAGATTTVVINPTPSTPVPTSNSPICQGSTINLNVPTVTNASYAWNGPNGFTSTSQNPSIVNGQAINAGTYSVTVTVTGCPSSAGSVSVTVNPPATVDAGSNLASCNGGTVNLSGTIGGSASSSTWSGGTGSFGNSTSPTSTYTPSPGDITAGSVVLTLTTNNPTGPCLAVSDVVTITISSSPSATFSYPPSTFCQSSTDPAPSFPLGSSGGVFSSTAGLSINSTTGIIDVSASTPGTYTVTNNIAANGACPAANATTSVTIVATPGTPTASSSALVCENGTINLSTPFVSGATYSWSGPNSYSSTLQNPSITPATPGDAGTYSVTITENGCPSANGTTIVSITPNPNVSITNGNTAAICANESIDLTATGATSYSWSDGTLNAMTTVSPTGTTTYTVTGTANGCSSQASITVTINALPTLTANPTATQSNCDSPTGSLVNIQVNGSPILTYLWTDATNAAVGINQDLTNVAAGSYSVQVTDGLGCMATFGPFTVSNFPTPSSPVISFTTNNPCEYGTIEGFSTSIAGASYSWSGPNGFSSTNQNFIIDPINTSFTGNYCLSAIVNGCPSAPSCQIITVETAPILTIDAANNDSVACINDLIVLNASGATSYAWTGPNGFTASTASVSFTTVNMNQSGYYIVTGTSGTSCIAIDSILVQVNPLPVIDILTDVNASGTYCSGASAQLTANGGTIYQWTGPNGFSSFNNIIQINPITELNDGIYSVQVTDQNGCTSSDSITISVNPSDFGGITGDSTICPGATLQLTASGGGTYSWTGPNQYSNTSSTVTIPNFQSNQTGVYSVLITDTNGCTTTQSTTTAISYSPLCLVIPGLVTPDGNGDNDSWVIPGLDQFPNAEVSVFNRWGNLVYFVQPYLVPWDGSPNEGLKVDGGNGRVPVGTYFYVIRLNDSENNEYKGYLELQY